MSLEIAFDRLTTAVEILGNTVRKNFEMIKTVDKFAMRLSKMIDHLVKASDIQNERLKVLEEIMLKKVGHVKKTELPN